MTSATRLTKKSAKASSGLRDDDLDEAATFRPGDTAGNRESEFDPNPDETQAAALDEEVAMEEERLREEELKKKKISDTDY
mmetsp:Transcript_13206/g.20588  ORF Transcript_13206/g.20588 Transcript_13206/m.20588 type:complete len:81 (+) Transcript_13206:2119-2361(+)